MNYKSEVLTIVAHLESHSRCATMVRIVLLYYVISRVCLITLERVRS